MPAERIIQESFYGSEFKSQPGHIRVPRGRGQKFGGHDGCCSRQISQHSAVSVFYCWSLTPSEWFCCRGKLTALFDLVRFGGLNSEDACSPSAISCSPGFIITDP